MLCLQVSWLQNNGCEVVVVTSGAVAVGRLRMKQEQMLSQSVRRTLLGSSDHTLSISRDQLAAEQEAEPRACAAAGQAGLMALYETMFAQYGVSCAQVKVIGQPHYLQQHCSDACTEALQQGSTSILRLGTFSVLRTTG